MSRAAERAALFAAHRAELGRELRKAGRGKPAGTLAAYLVALHEPTGYLIASGLQQRFGVPDPDRILMPSVARGARTAVASGIVARTALAEVVDKLAPAVQGVAAELRFAGATQPPCVLVAIGGGAEIFRLEKTGVGPLRGRRP